MSVTLSYACIVIVLLEMESVRCAYFENSRLMGIGSGER